MSDTNYPLMADGGPDDLPRTLRRERDAREREARERLAKEREAALAAQAAASPRAQPQMPTPGMAGDAAAGGHGMGGGGMGSAGMGGPSMADPFVVTDQDFAHAAPLPSVVRRFDVPFLHLVGFFLKAVLAMVPALIVLGLILWGIGQFLQTFFPHLVKMQILIWFPN